MAVMDDADRSRCCEPPSVRLCVLGSGSGGNCTVLVVEAGGRRRAWLIDAGFSARRTCKLLARVGLALDEIEGVLLTHLDHDHWYAGWGKALPGAVAIHIHQTHLTPGGRLNGASARAAGFRGDFSLAPGVDVSPVLQSHDESGTSAFRFSFSTAEGCATLGFATDLGRATPALIDHFAGVDVLAIESNYCPRMQLESGRPAFLKRRIMGGRGHLSNQQAAEAVTRINPRGHVVFLHLSRQCNRPELVRDLHRGSRYTFTISAQSEPTDWVPVRPGPPAPPMPGVNLGLWSQAVGGNYGRASRRASVVSSPWGRTNGE